MATWDELHKTAKVREVYEGVAEFAKAYLKPGMRVLDLGCGTGRHSLYCARLGIETHAVDISDAGLSKLVEESKKGQLFERLKITKSDIREMPFPNAYFDAIICVNVINHGYKKDVEAYFKEAGRVLKPEGLFFLLVAPPEFIDAVRTEKTVEAEEGTFINIDMPDGEVPHHLLSDKELKALLEGYDILKIKKSKGLSQWKDLEITREEIIARKHGKQHSQGA